jgi:hypothetical protein
VRGSHPSGMKEAMEGARGEWWLRVFASRWGFGGGWSHSSLVTSAGYGGRGSGLVPSPRFTSRP